MPNEVLTQFLEWLHRYFPSMALAAFGTIIQALNRHHDEWSWKRFAIGIAKRVFCGARDELPAGAYVHFSCVEKRGYRHFGVFVQRRSQGGFGKDA